VITNLCEEFVYVDLACVVRELFDEASTEGLDLTLAHFITSVAKSLGSRIFAFKLSPTTDDSLTPNFHVQPRLEDWAVITGSRPYTHGPQINKDRGWHRLSFYFVCFPLSGLHPFRVSAYAPHLVTDS